MKLFGNLLNIMHHIGITSILFVFTNQVGGNFIEKRSFSKVCMTRQDNSISCQSVKIFFFNLTRLSACVPSKLCIIGNKNI